MKKLCVHTLFKLLLCFILSEPLRTLGPGGGKGREDSDHCPIVSKQNRRPETRDRPDQGRGRWRSIKKKDGR